MADKAFEQYGYVATLAQAVPELRDLLSKALKAKWSTDEFSRNLQDSKWWKNSADSVKQNQILKATKPGEYRQQRDLAAGKVHRMAGQMGIALNGAAVNALVNHAMALGWDDVTLSEKVGAYFRTPSRGRTAGGQAGALQQQLREIRTQYGNGHNEEAVGQWVRNILMGRATLDGYRAQNVAGAKARYPSFAEQIDAGQTLLQIADPYMSTMAQTLELSPSNIQLKDPAIQRAMTARDEKGAPKAQPLWAFQDALRQDKRYDHTTQAVNDAYTMVSQIGKSWGFSA